MPRYTGEYGTASEVVVRAAVQLGLPEPADVWASADSAIVRLRSLLGSLGQYLVRQNDWQSLRATHTFTTTGNQQEYDLPTDFHRLVPQTWWNESKQLPGNSISAAEAAYLRGQSTGVVWNVLFRRHAGQLQLWPENVPNNETVSFEYVSRYWVSPQGQSAPTADYPTANNDVLYFDEECLVQGLKLEFLVATGLPGQDAQGTKFLDLLGAAIVADGTPRTLSVVPRATGIPLLGAHNVPPTGVGT